MIGKLRAIGKTRYAVLQREDLLLLYQSGYDWLEDDRLSKFPADALVYATWEQVQQVVSRDSTSRSCIGVSCWTS